MEEIRKSEVYLVFSGGTEKERNSFKNIVYNELFVDNEKILGKRRSEVPEDVRGVLGLPPELLDPDVINLVIILTPVVIKGIQRLINLIKHKEEKISRNIDIVMVIDKETIIIKSESLNEEKIIKILRSLNG